jgi:hypothetical protein
VVRHHATRLHLDCHCNSIHSLAQKPWSNKGRDLRNHLFAAKADGLTNWTWIQATSGVYALYTFALLFGAWHGITSTKTMYKWCNPCDWSDWRTWLKYFLAYMFVFLPAALTVFLASLKADGFIDRSTSTFAVLAPLHVLELALVLNCYMEHEANKFPFHYHVSFLFRVENVTFILLCVSSFPPLLYV